MTGGVAPTDFLGASRPRAVERTCLRSALRAEQKLEIADSLRLLVIQELALKLNAGERDDCIVGLFVLFVDEKDPLSTPYRVVRPLIGSRKQIRNATGS